MYSLIKGAMSAGGSEVRLCGISIGEALLQIVEEIGMELSTCFGQGYDGAASLASERVGAAATFLAQYFHCAMHCLNLCAAQTVKIQAIQHAHDVIKETVSVFKSSAKRTDVLKSSINDEDDSRISKTQLLSLCTTRFVERQYVTSYICAMLQGSVEVRNASSSRHDGMAVSRDT